MLLLTNYTIECKNLKYGNLNQLVETIRLLCYDIVEVAINEIIKNTKILKRT